MLNRLFIRNFKRFEEVCIDLGNPVVFAGPNQSGKTTAMQALALWDIGLKKWNERRSGKRSPKSRSGVTINRRDLLAVPHPRANLLWRDLRVRTVSRVNGQQLTENVRIDLVVDGTLGNGSWKCGLEFDFANLESFYCRPLRLGEGTSPERMPVPREAEGINIAFLPPMSGLAATETRLDPGAVNVRLGEGRTADVLRNLCYQILTERPDKWELLVRQIRTLFGAELCEPLYVEERGELTMDYRERGSVLDLSSSGRGLQQTLLILSYMYAHPGSVILLDEPDAHLEVLRQRQIYKLLTEAASEGGNQVIAASHSEVLLNEAAGRDQVIAFTGSPHPITSDNRQLRKALTEIGFEPFLQAEQSGWVLYLEGPTDLAILQEFAERLGHTAAAHALRRPFVRYVGNQPRQAQHHYYGLRDALPGLRGIAIFDRLDIELAQEEPLLRLAWRKREIENYLCTERTLEAYANATATQAEPGPLFQPGEVQRRMEAMRQAIDEISSALQTIHGESPWSDDVKVSDTFLKPLFRTYFQKLELTNVMAKKQFHELARYVPLADIDLEVSEKLDAIGRVADSGSESDSGSPP